MSYPKVLCPRCSVLNQAQGAMIDGSAYVDDDWVEASYRLEITDQWPGIVIVRCGHCDQFFVVMTSASGADPVWPMVVPQTPSHVPEVVANAYRDARVASAAGSKIGALMAGRTTLERILRDKGVSQLVDLVKNGLILQMHFDASNSLRLWANMSTHRDLPDDAFSMAEVNAVLDYLKLLLQTLYSQPQDIKKLTEKTAELKSK